MSVRDQIRAATLGEKSEFRSEVVKYNGVEVEVRQPSVKARKELFKRCMDEAGRVDTMEFLTWSVIYNTYVPNSNELVFEDTDYDAMVEKPAGGFMDQFGEVAARVMNVEEDEDVEKK